MIEINQARAEAGDVTPDDLPGFPILISRNGSYRLTSDLRVPNAENAISIESALVAIDLNGFGIYGPCAFFAPGCSFGGTGAGIDAPFGGVTIRNGFVVGTNNDGVRLGGGSRVVDLTVFGGGADGIEVVDGGSVQSSLVLNNAGVGLRLGPTTSFAGNESRGNAGGSRTGGTATAGNSCDDGRCTRDGRRRFYLSTQFAGVSGWTRTGFLLTSAANPAGEPNCLDYTSNSGNGTIVQFESAPNTGTNAWSPWEAALSLCSQPQRVWCIED